MATGRNLVVQQRRAMPQQPGSQHDWHRRHYIDAALLPLSCCVCAVSCLCFLFVFYLNNPACQSAGIWLRNVGPCASCFARQCRPGRQTGHRIAGEKKDLGSRSLVLLAAQRRLDSWLTARPTPSAATSTAQVSQTQLRSDVGGPEGTRPA